MNPVEVKEEAKRLNSNPKQSINRLSEEIEQEEEEFFSADGEKVTSEQRRV